MNGEPERERQTWKTTPAGRKALETSIARKEGGPMIDCEPDCLHCARAKVLGLLKRDALTIAQLAERTGLDRPVLSAMISRLRKKKLVAPGSTEWNSGTWRAT